MRHLIAIRAIACQFRAVLSFLLASLRYALLSGLGLKALKRWALWLFQPRVFAAPLQGC